MAKLITTTGSGLINGMIAHVGPFQVNLISVPALLTMGVRPVFDLKDPHMLLPTGERYGEVTYSETEGFCARILIDHPPKAASPTISLFSLGILNHICLRRGMYKATIDFMGAFSNVPLPKNSFQTEGKRQAAYNSLTILAAFLLTVGFCPFTMEPDIFYRRTGEPPHEALSLIGTHVDDLKCAFDKAADFETFYRQCSDWLTCTRTNGQRLPKLDFQGHFQRLKYGLAGLDPIGGENTPGGSVVIPPHR